MGTGPQERDRFGRGAGASAACCPLAQALLAYFLIAARPTKRLTFCESSDLSIHAKSLGSRSCLPSEATQGGGRALPLRL